jgi:hypothetical protein
VAPWLKRPGNREPSVAEEGGGSSLQLLMVVRLHVVARLDRELHTGLENILGRTLDGWTRVATVGGAGAALHVTE